jgi:hypothetical protein
MIRKDLKYVETGRPNRSEENKYESYLRTFGILQLPTGSELYDTLFTKLTTILKAPSDYVEDELSTLVEQWEIKHPEQTFFIE